MDKLWLTWGKRVGNALRGRGVAVRCKGSFDFACGSLCDPHAALRMTGLAGRFAQDDRVSGDAALTMTGLTGLIGGGDRRGRPRRGRRRRGPGIRFRWRWRG